MYMFRATLGESPTSQFLLMPIALVIGLMFLPYLVWMNAEAIISLKEQAVSAHLVEVKPSFDRVDRALSRKDFDGALVAVESYLNENSNNIDVWMKVADVHIFREEFDQALIAFDRALPIASEKPEIQASIYMRMADLYWDHMSNPQRAKEILQKLKDLNLTERSARFASIRLEAIN